LIRTWRPWEKSTRPKSAVGKVKVSRNAYKDGTWRLLRELACELREQKKVIQETEARLVEMR